MQVKRLNFEEDARVLAKLSKNAESLGDSELQRRWRWIKKITSTTEACQTIAALWAHSSFIQLRNWGQHVKTASVLLRNETDEDGSQASPALLLGLDESNSVRIEIIPPFRPAEASAYARRAPPAAAELVAEMLMLAPSLSLGWVPGYGGGGHGVLCAPSFFDRPMKYINYRIESYLALFDAAGIVPNRVPTANGCACEILETVLGDAYLLREDCSIMFFDHEEVNIFPVAVGLHRLIEVYLGDSERVLEPSDLDDA